MLKNLLVKSANQNDLNDIAIFENKFFLNDAYSIASLYQMFNDANYEIVIVEYEQKNIGYLIYMKTIDFNEILKIGVDAVSYTHLRAHRDRTRSRMPSSA